MVLLRGSHLEGRSGGTVYGHAGATWKCIMTYMRYGQGSARFWVTGGTNGGAAAPGGRSEGSRR